MNADIQLWQHKKGQSGYSVLFIVLVAIIISLFFIDDI